ncbi:GNAT family N-acetyltransferase [Roseomonas aerophila]|uniref:GNAT family N-acetyltransferase n=1 Tax=Teichococcus aerophilus TaxID=1224513 RepID=A0ABR7RSA5_9PROT|nr:GNAT family N-acetyltransferase [Pseudoroseomonas aerophila]MBC9209228.1 GNAT family N-acetyltransferase [Pseudoroseomonas aerophila]
MSIRPARPGEDALLAALVERAYAHYLPVIGRRPAPMDDDYAARIAAGQAWVLEDDARILGLLVLEDAPDHLWLDNIALDPDLGRKGLGQLLMRFVFDEARQRGVPEVRLLTNALMTRNIGIYQRLGFTEYDRREENGFFRVYMRAAVD